MLTLQKLFQCKDFRFNQKMHCPLYACADNYSLKMEKSNDHLLPYSFLPHILLKNLEAFPLSILWGVVRRGSNWKIKKTEP